MIIVLSLDLKPKGKNLSKTLENISIIWNESFFSKSIYDMFNYWENIWQNNKNKNWNPKGKETFLTCPLVWMMY